MRTPIPALGLIIIFLSSCSYQYLTIASDDTPTNENLEFVTETDSVRVTYNFHGHNGPVQITIYNKLAEGLVVDWKKSALIIGETPIAYYSPNLRVNGFIKDSQWYNRSVDRTSSFGATVYRDQAKEFIPPLSKILQSGYFVTNGKGFIVDSMKQKPVEEKITVNGMRTKIRKVNFDKSNSPVVFRSYLTFLAGSDESRVFTFSNSFYISQLVDSKSDMAITRLYGAKGNEFYITY
jgi:hypothetical protein